jgi:pimeloyl-ACP methyl ester carboxylesterase
MVSFTDLTWTSADGLTLHARDYAPAGQPTGLPVIAIHGLTRNARDFETIAPGIAGAGRRVLAVDVRGRGQSDRAPDPMTYVPPVYAGDILALMAGEAIERAVFLGTSMGGLITMALGALRPDVVAAAILNDIGPELAPEGLARIARYAGQPVDTPTWAAAADYVRAINQQAFPHYGPADWDAFARRTFRDGPNGRPEPDCDPAIAVPFAARAGQPAPDLWPLFMGLTMGRPVLLIRGETSDLLSADTAERMRQAAPDMAYAEVPGVGHAPMLDEPPARAAIETFLERAP